MLLTGVGKWRVKDEENEEKHLGCMRRMKKVVSNEILLCVCWVVCDVKPLPLLPILCDGDFSGPDRRVGSVLR